MILKRKTAEAENLKCINKIHTIPPDIGLNRKAIMAVSGGETLTTEAEAK